MNSDYTYLALLTGVFVLLAIVGFVATERERREAAREQDRDRGSRPASAR